MTDEEKKAIEYYKNSEGSFSFEFKSELDRKIFFKALGIDENDTFEKHQIRFQTLINLIEKQHKRINELEKILDERFIYVTGARTIYARLMSLDKEIIVRDDLKLRNEIEQNIKDEGKLKVELKKKDKIIDAMSDTIETSQYANIDNTDLSAICDYLKCKKECISVEKECIKEYFKKKEG